MRAAAAVSEQPRYDFKGRKLSVVPAPASKNEEPSPLHEAISKYLESLSVTSDGPR